MGETNMKHMKMAIVCTGAAALFLAAGAGTASAAVLCKENVATCKVNIYPMGTQLTGGSASNMLFETVGGVLLERRERYHIFARAAIGGGWALTFFVFTRTRRRIVHYL